MYSATWRRMVTEGGVSLYLLGAVALGGLAAASFTLEDREIRRGDWLGALETDDVSWASALTAFDEALARGDASAALRIWSEAHSAALRSRHWEGMLAVGDARLRIDQSTGPGSTAVAKAREAYLAALFRARQEGSLEGVIRAAEAFDALGDVEVANAIRGAWGTGFASALREREVLAAEP
jgi:hypothetical protein